MLMPQPLPPQLLPPHPPRPPPRRWASLTCGVSSNSAAAATNPSIAENLNFNMSLPLDLQLRSHRTPRSAALPPPRNTRQLQDQSTKKSSRSARSTNLTDLELWR